MKRFAILWTVLMGLSIPLFGSTYQWTRVTTAGPTIAVNMSTLGGSTASDAPSGYTVDAVTSGTAPTTCTFEVESSPDGTNWNQGTGSLSGTKSCANVGVLTQPFQAMPVAYIRINVTALSGGDGTTGVTFHLTRGTSR